MRAEFQHISTVLWLSLKRIGAPVRTATEHLEYPKRPLQIEWSIIFLPNTGSKTTLYSDKIYEIISGCNLYIKLTSTSIWTVSLFQTCIPIRSDCPSRALTNLKCSKIATTDMAPLFELHQFPYLRHWIKTSSQPLHDFVEWLEGNMYLDFNEHDYASHLDLIAKTNGLNEAEHYIQRIPQSFRGEVIYRTLLASCANTTNVKRSSNVKKAEEVFKKMRDLGFPLSIYTCNHLLLLYKRFDPRKITDVVELMKKENVKPSLESYRHLIDSRGRANDILGMEAVMESMTAEGVKPDLLIQSSIAKYYIFGGLNEKAEQVLKDMGGDNIEDHGKACKFLLPLYAALHKADDVMRVWKLCESNPSKEECLAAIEAFGKLGRVESAEELFETTMKKCNEISSEYYNALLNVYANHKLLTKGEGLAKRMSDNGCTIGPVTWDALVNLYVSAGEVEKADSILAEADKKSMIKPWFNSYMAILSKYSVRGDFDNAEKIFERMRRNGHTVGRFSPYHLLLQAYIHAKAPAYGFRERLNADNLIPNRTLSVQLAIVDPFKNTPASE